MIRTALASDAAEIAALFHRTVKEVNGHDYSPEQIRAWAGDVPEPEKWLSRLSGNRTLVCEQAGVICGFAEFERNGHIGAVYVHADYQGQGIASRLLCHLEAEADQLGLDRLFTEASITARPFFAARGFTLIEAQAVQYRGCTFLNYRMEKRRPNQTSEPAIRPCAS